MNGPLIRFTNYIDELRISDLRRLLHQYNYRTKGKKKTLVCRVRQLLFDHPTTAPESLCQVYDQKLKDDARKKKTLPIQETLKSENAVCEENENSPINNNHTPFSDAQRTLDDSQKNCNEPLECSSTNSSLSNENHFLLLYSNWRNSYHKYLLENYLYYLFDPISPVKVCNKSYNESYFEKTQQFQFAPHLLERSSDDRKLQVFISFHQYDDINKLIQLVPKNLKLLINNTYYEQNVQSRIDITPYISYQLNATNHISVSFTVNLNKTVIMSCYASIPLSVNELAQFCSKHIIPPEISKSKLSNLIYSPNEISNSNFKLTLICPLSKTRFQYPCRSVLCRHVQCFDLINYLQMNFQRTKWLCPICNQPAKPCDLRIDEFLKNLLGYTSEDTVECSVNNSRDLIIRFNQSQILNIQQPNVTQKNPEVITLSDDE